MGTEKIWYVYIGGGHLGPLSEEDLKKRVESGSVVGASYVWKVGMSDWVKLESLELFTKLKTQKGSGGSYLGQQNEEIENRSFKPIGDLQLDQDFEKTKEKKVSVSEAISRKNIDEKQLLGSKIQNPSKSENSDLNFSEKSIEKKFEIEKNSKKNKWISVPGLGVLLIVGAGILVASANKKNEKIWSYLVREKNSIPEVILSWTTFFPSLAPFELQDESKKAIIELVLTPLEEEKKPKIKVFPEKTKITVYSNLFNGSKFEVIAIGVPHTLVGTLKSQKNEIIELSGGMATLEVNDIVPGFYDVTVVDAPNQQPEVQNFLSKLLPTPFDVPDGYAKERKLGFQKRFFMGDLTKEEYEKNLRIFHERIRNRSKENRLQSRQMLSVFQNQVLSLKEIGLKEEILKKKNQKKLEEWIDFSSEILSSQTSIEFAPSLVQFEIDSKNFLKEISENLKNQKADSILLSQFESKLQQWSQILDDLEVNPYQENGLPKTIEI